MGRWELWGTDCEWSFFSEDNDAARQMAVRDGHELLWEVDAPSRNAAHQARNDYFGWGKYEPMLRADGTPYPEDEADDIG